MSKRVYSFGTTMTESAIKEPALAIDRFLEFSRQMDAMNSIDCAFAVQKSNRDLLELNALASRPTYARRRAEAMGFTFDKILVVKSPMSFGYLMRCVFTCICGKTEVFQCEFDKLLLTSAMSRDRIIDPADWLTRNGSFSRKHLLADGYTEAQVFEIESKGIEFDRLNSVVLP